MSLRGVSDPGMDGIRVDRPVVSGCECQRPAEYGRALEMSKALCSPVKGPFWALVSGAEQGLSFLNACTPWV